MSDYGSEFLQYYRILEVEPGASLAEIKRSYRELAKVWHPDRFPNDIRLQRKAQEKLKQINLAYERICGRGGRQPPRQSRPTASSPPPPPRTATRPADTSSGDPSRPTASSPPPPSSSATESADASSDGNRRASTAPRKRSFDFRWIAVFFSKCAQSLEKGFVGLSRGLTKGVIAIRVLFALLKTNIFKVSDEVFRWYSREKKSLAVVTIALVLGVALGIWLLVWIQLRDVSTTRAPASAHLQLSPT